MPGWQRYILGEGVVGGWYSLSARVMVCGGVLGVESGGVDLGNSLSRREIDCGGWGEEVERKRLTKGFVEGRVDVRARMSDSRFEDS